MWGYFSAVAGADGQIDAEELQRCLTSAGVADYPRPGIVTIVFASSISLAIRRNLQHRDMPVWL
jgi:hypothetical protein